MRWKTEIEQRHVEVRVFTYEITDLKGNVYTKQIEEQVDWYDYEYGPSVFALNMKDTFERHKIIKIDDTTIISRSAVLVIKLIKTEKKHVEMSWKHVGLQDWSGVEWVAAGAALLVIATASGLIFTKLTFLWFK